MQELTPPSDAELVARSIDGDQASFAAIYDRYADRLHSYCFVMLRDPHSAADAMHDTFVKAATRLTQLRDPSKLRPWLFAIARNEANAQGRMRGKQELVDDLSEELVTDPDPSLGIAQDELKELVWSAVAGLQDRDRELMSLHLVEGLEGADLANAMGVKDSHLHVMLTRMRDRVEKALGALLIARQGRKDCDELAELLADWDGYFTLDIRSKVTRHVESCDVCSRNRALLVSPAALLPSVVFIPAPTDLRGSVLRDAGAALVATKPSVASPSKGALWAIASLAAGLVLLLGGIGVSAALNQSQPPTEVALVSITSSSVVESPAPVPAEPAPTLAPVSSTIPPVETSTTTHESPSTTDTTSPAQPPPPAVSDLVLDVGSVDFGAASRAATVSLSNLGTQPTSWTVSGADQTFAVSPQSGQLGPGETASVTLTMLRTSLPEGSYGSVFTFVGDHNSASVDLSGRIEINPTFLRPTARPSVVRVPSAPACGAAVSTISVIVFDDSPVDSVVVAWGPTGGTAIATMMTHAGNGAYTATIGPFYVQGDMSPVITATDDRGNSASTSASLIALLCP